jgi:glycosyltransferase involved in cell wall biosynthesis
MLKIAMVAEHAQLRGTAHVAALAEAMTRAGHEVTVLGGKDNLTAAVRACRPDVVHAHCRSDDAMAAARALDVPFVFSLHADLREPVPRRADHVLVTFTRQRQRLIAAGVPRQHTSVVPYGVDVDHFTPDGGHADRRRPQLVIAQGAMAPSSGFGTAVAALPGIPDAELVVVSESGKGTHAAELRDYADSLGVADRVRLVGPVPHADVPTLLRSADLMVCSSWESNFGMAAVEAMACGLAVVANRTGGLVDTVVDKVTGIHVAPRRPRELAAALRRLLGHKATCEQLGAAGRDRATARYSWDRVATETVYAYQHAGVTDPEVLARDAAEAARKRATR